MSVSTRDLVKGVDFTAVTILTGSQYNQLVDMARAASDKGMLVYTKDTALNTPEVPDPDGTYDDAGSDVLPVWWKRYLWIREPFAAGPSLVYVWSDLEASDATYLKWVQLGADGAEALVVAEQALAIAEGAATAANEAQIVADGADIGAQVAIATANAAQASVTALTAQIATLGSMYPGQIFALAWLRAFSTSTNQGALACDGSEVSLSIFPNLTSMVGIWGAASAGNVKLPDFRGVGLAGAGTGSWTFGGASLSARSAGFAGIAGKEAHQLTPAQNAPHRHFIANVDELSSPTSNELTDVKSIVKNTDGLGEEEDYELFGTVTEPTIGRTSEQGGSGVGPTVGDAFSLMQPTAFVYYYIKT